MRRQLSAFLLVLILLALPAVAGANSAPPRTSGDKSGVLVPGQSSQVHITRELLQFAIEHEGSAQVTARYEMENRGAALTDLPVAFAVQDAGGKKPLTITWNGTPLSVTMARIDEVSDAQRQQMEQAWTAMDFVVDPVTGESHPFTDAHGQSMLQLGLFTISLPAGGSGTLEVTYENWAAADRRLYAYTVYYFQYLLLPAKSWASFGPLEIRIQGADPKSSFFKSNLPFTYERGEWRANFDGLPDENLAFSLMSRKGIVGNMVTPGPYRFVQFLLFGGLVTLLAIGLGRWCSALRKKGWAVTVAVLATGLVVGVAGVPVAFLLMALLPPAVGSGYDSAFFSIAEVVLSVPITMMIAGAVAAGRHRRRFA